MTPPVRRLGPNDVQPCGSDGARRRHLAKAERCTVCGTEGRIIPAPIDLRRAA